MVIRNAIRSTTRSPLRNPLESKWGATPDTYAVEGFSPAGVADFENEYYRVGGSDTTFASMFTFSRASTATYDDSSGTIQTATSGTARIGNHVWDGSAWVNKGILLETGARTNIFLHSNNFSDAVWVKTTSTVTAASGISPDGTNNAWRWTDTGSTTHTLQQFFTESISSTYTVSVWVKSNEASEDTFRLFGSNTSLSSVFTATSEWQRFSFTLTVGSAANRAYGITRDSSNNPVDLLVYGFQVELGATPSSYIPTAGSTVTRAAEVLTSPFANVPTIGSVHLKGTITYADLGTTSQHTLWRQYKDADEYITCDLDTDGADTGEINFEQNNAGTLATVTSDSLSPGVNVAFNVASRHGTSVINGAVAGTAGTEVTTSSTLPTFTTQAFAPGYAMNGNLTLLRLWSDDITDAGIETAST